MLLLNDDHILLHKSFSVATLLVSKLSELIFLFLGLDD